MASERGWTVGDAIGWQESRRMVDEERHQRYFRDGVVQRHNLLEQRRHEELIAVLARIAVALEMRQV